MSRVANGSSSFLTNLMAFGASEVSAKATRLLVVVAISRTLSAENVGYAAAALAVGEVLKSLTENGIGQRIIAAHKDNLEAVCHSAHRLFWGYCVGLTVVQMAIGCALHVAGQTTVGALVGLMAIEYLFMPAGLVQVALAMRENRLKRVAVISAIQVSGANLITVALAFAWASPLVLILPRVLTAPIWLVAVRHLRPWQRKSLVHQAPLQPFVTYGLPVTGIELVKALRLHADKIVVGAVLGPKALGIYFLAFNAGLSLATSFCAALGIVLFPHLCKEADQHAALRRTVTLSIICILPVVLLQSLFASVYVPLLLGAKWGHIAPTVSLLCFAALPLTIWTSVAASLRVSGRPKVEFTVTLILTIALVFSAILAAPYGLTTMATAYVATTTTILLAAALPHLMKPAQQDLRKV
ncbi:polysaccharide biosynthesis protein [Parasedimentitalea marina]|uniref:Polysaccharide biosynthesis protein n=1 Tax=Parasedimentitalea marina TaxID=2483033 RepID=A0A3T0N0D2_9RHOB|nr:oligosaccharide flippase family protein [Parasedimentitalea marina]AZV77471.1 polysaccharide biosynthesis protein [Parasedimentitalea marina]